MWAQAHRAPPVARAGAVIFLLSAVTLSLFSGQAHAEIKHPTVAIAATAEGTGYWLATNHGEVHTYGAAPHHGESPDGAGDSIIGFAPTDDDSGYWLASSTGQVYAYGSAKKHGGAPEGYVGTIAGFAAKPDGTGYWLASSTGQVYAYGSAGNHGQTPENLNAPVVGMASAPDGKGYWLVSAAGQVHAYGSAEHHGDSPGSYRGTIVDLAPTPDGSGYWMTSSSGQIFSYGSTQHHGGAARSGSSPVTGITSTPTGEGYWQVVADHQVSPNGDARFFGTLLLDESHDRKYPSFTATVGAWGGRTNGRIPASTLCRIDRGDHRLRCDAATALLALDASFREEFGEPLRITDSYRSYDGQVRTRARWCQQRMCYKAAIPGTSNHGWGLAIDIGSGVNSFGTPQHEWMRQNAGKFGWIHPLWAQQGGSNEEAWHWEFAGTG